MLKIIRKLLFATLIFSMNFVNIAFCVTNGKSEIYDIVYLESDVVDIDFTDEFEKRNLTGLTPNISPYFNAIYYFASPKDQWERLDDYYDRIFFEIIQHDEYFYSLKFKVYYQVSNLNWVTQRLVDKKVGDIFPGGYVHLLVEPLDKNGTRAASLIDYIVPEFDFRVVSISPNPNSTNSSLNNNKSSNSSNNSSTDDEFDDDEFDVEYSFPEDEFTGPGVDTAQNNNLISNTSTNEMTINETPTNSYSVSQSNSATYDTNNTYNAGNNVQGLPVVKAGDIVRCRMVAYKDGELYVDKLYEGGISTDELIKTFAGHYLGETFTQKFEGTSNVAYYTILLINGVSEEDFRQQQASQALAQSIQADSSQKAINDYTKADTPLVGVNNASQNDDSAILLPSNKSELKDDNHFYLDNSLQKDTWVYDTVYYYYVDKNGDIEKNKWIDNRFVGEDGRMYRSRQTPDGLWVGDNGIVVDINLDLYNSTIEKEVTPDSWYCTNAGLWYYFENDRTTTKKGWFTDSSDNQTYYLDPITGIMQVGWVSIDGKYYYFNDQHENEVNWKETGGGFYESLGKKVKAYGSMFKNEETPDGYFVNENGEYTEKKNEETTDGYFVNENDEYTRKKNTNATGKISWVFVILVILLIFIIIIIIFRRLKTKFNREHSVKFKRRDN